MTEKSYVSMANYQCPICTTEHSANELLLDTQLRKRFERTTIVGAKVCPKCAQRIKDGYIAFIVIDPKRSSTPFDLHTVHRTGDICWVREKLCNEIFHDFSHKDGIVFTDMELMEKLKSMIPT